MTPKNTKRLLLLALLLFLAIAAVGLRMLLHDGESADPVVFVKYTVTDGTAEATLQFRGLLQSSRSVPVIVMTNGRISELAKQGAVVKKGDVLCVIDDSSARENIENQETQLNANELELEQLHAQYELADFQEQNKVKLCRARLENAILAEAEELAVPDEDDRRLLEIDEQLATLDVQDAQENYDRQYRMLQKKYISPSALEPYERTLENAKANLKEMLLKNNITRKGATQERRIELRKAVERAQSNLDRVDLKRKRRLNDIKAQINASEKNLATINFSIENSQKQIDAATIHSPADGIFLIKIFRDWASGGTLREVYVGNNKNLYDVIGEIIDPTVMKIRLVVNEADFPLLAEGMPVTVTLPAFPGRAFKGSISQLGAIGKERNKVDPTAISDGVSEVIMYNASIVFDGEGTSFNPGMSALISVQTKPPQNALFIPRDALSIAPDGSTAVFTAPDGTTTHPVQGRFFNDMLFLVKDGLKPDDTIFIRKTRQK